MKNKKRVIIYITSTILILSIALMLVELPTSKKKDYQLNIDIEEKKHINSALNINEEDIIDYLIYLDKNNYEKTSIVRKIVSIKLFHKYLSEKYHIEDISIKIDKPRVRRKLPNILSIEEVDNLLDIELNNAFDYRNKAT